MHVARSSYLGKHEGQNTCNSEARVRGVGGGLVNRNNIKEIVSEGVTMVCVVQIGNGLCGSDREWFVWFR